jgi:hypothetical protein
VEEMETSAASVHSISERSHRKNSELRPERPTRFRPRLTPESTR